MSPYRSDARLSGRHPFETFMLALAAFASIPALFGAAPDPGSIEAALPPIGGFLWSLILTVGSIVALAGTYWKDRATGLILEQLGLAFVGVAAFIYTGVALSVVGLSAAIPAAIIAGFGAACLKRWRDLQSVIDAVHEEEKRRRGEI